MNRTRPLGTRTHQAQGARVVSSGPKNQRAELTRGLPALEVR